MKYAVENGIIDLEHVQEEIEMKEREEILKKHPYKIWFGEDKEWHTYLPDEEKGRVQRHRKTEKEIQDLIVKYWKEKKEIHTIESVFYEWINEKIKYKEIEKSTYDRYETDFKRFFDSSFRKSNIRNVTEDTLEEFIKTTISEKQLTSKAYSGLRTLLIGMFKYAKKHKYSGISVCTFFGDLNLSKKIFTKKVRCIENEVFTEEEIKKIIGYIHSKQYKIRELGVLLAIYTGMRPGELSTLKASDINLKNRTIHIQRSQIKYKGENGKCIIDVREYPKSDAGDRYLLLSDRALDTTKQILRLNPFGNFLFQDEHTRKRITENGFNHKLARICEAVDIPVRTMHKLRKTYGTTLIDHGVSDSIITEQMGHADIKTTRQYYYYSNHGQNEKIEQLNQACIM